MNKKKLFCRMLFGLSLSVIFPVHADLLGAFSKTLEALSTAADESEQGTNKNRQSIAEKQINSSQNPEADDVYKVLQEQSLFRDDSLMFQNSCGADHVKFNERFIADGAGRSDSGLAAQAAATAAGQFSYCILERKADFSTYLPIVSKFQVTALLYRAKDLIVRDVGLPSRTRVILSHLISAGNDDAKANLKQLMDAGYYKEERLSNSSVSVDTTATKFWKLWDANHLAFDRKYKGQKVRIAGKISVIAGVGDSAIISVNDTGSSAGLNNMSGKYVVDCHINNKQDMDLLMNLRNGSNVTIEGAYDPSIRSALSRNLSPCGIVRGS